MHQHNKARRRHKFFFDDFIEKGLESFDTRDINKVPLTNVIEEENKYLLKMAAPGLKKEDFSVTLDGNFIVISSAKEAKNPIDTGYIKKEFNFFKFIRKFEIPNDINCVSINASYKQGILELQLPKKEATPEIKKKIKIL